MSGDPFLVRVMNIFINTYIFGGREEGRKEGRKEGREEGRKEGRKEGDLEFLSAGECSGMSPH